MNRKFLTFFLSILISLLTVGLPVAQADSNTVVTLGADLSPEQREMILQKLDAPSDTEPLEVTNREEIEALGKYLNPSVIGTRAYSSSKVVLMQSGSGIRVDTDENITWATRDMYTNALITAGVKDADVAIVAPFPVSGTAALTGIIKAFESAKDIKLSQKQIDAANEELVKMSILGKEIGDPQKATQLIYELKNHLGKVNPKTNNDYRTMINNIAKDLGIDLSEDQINSIMGLLKKLKSLDVDWKQLAKQAASINNKFSELVKENPEVRSLWKQAIGFFKNIFEIIFQLFE